MILVTGAAGFIGSQLTNSLLIDGHEVIGVDSINSFYDPKLKLSRINWIKKNNIGKNFKFFEYDLADLQSLEKIFKKYDVHAVINLAAQAGVRYSAINPQAFINSNIIGFHNIINLTQKYRVKNFLYASSSSVYGENKGICTLNCNTSKPLSLYAATKKSNEIMSHSYSEMFEMKTVGFRFFTIYGPMGRPDMAYYKFTKSILNNVAIDLYNHGNMKRDFTYIDDAVWAVKTALQKCMNDELLMNESKSKIFNIGRNEPIDLIRFINLIENLCNKKAIRINKANQAGDVPSTCADISISKQELGYNPAIGIEEGLKRFVNWYLKHKKTL